MLQVFYWSFPNKLNFQQSLPEQNFHLLFKNSIFNKSYFPLYVNTPFCLVFYEFFWRNTKSPMLAKNVLSKVCRAVFLNIPNLRPLTLVAVDFWAKNFINFGSRNRYSSVILQFWTSDRANLVKMSTITVSVFFRQIIDFTWNRSNLQNCILAFFCLSQAVVN